MFHFEYYCNRDFIPPNGLVCTDKIQATSLQHILAYQDKTYDALDPFPLINLICWVIPLHKRETKRHFKIRRRNLDTAATPSPSHIKANERRAIKVRGAQIWGFGCYSNTIKRRPFFFPPNHTSDDSTLTHCRSSTKAFLSQPPRSSSHSSTATN